MCAHTLPSSLMRRVTQRKYHVRVARKGPEGSTVFAETAVIESRARSAMVVLLSSSESWSQERGCEI